MNRSELIEEMQFKVKMANNILNDLMKDNTLAYSSYYNEYILPELKSYKFIGVKRKVQADRIEDSASSNYYTLKTGSIGYSKQDLRDRIRVE